MLAYAIIATITITLGAAYRPADQYKGTFWADTEPQSAPAPQVMRVYPQTLKPFKPQITLPYEAPELFETVEINTAEAELIAKTIYGEARGCPKTEQAAVAWCILNRVGVQGFADSIEGVITQPYQFSGYSASNPVLPELYDVAADVLTRWEREKLGATDVGRVLPAEYKWFSGDGEHNWFRDAYYRGNVWEWECTSPYDS